MVWRAVVVLECVWLYNAVRGISTYRESSTLAALCEYRVCEMKQV